MEVVLCDAFLHRFQSTAMLQRKSWFLYHINYTVSYGEENIAVPDYRSIRPNNWHFLPLAGSFSICFRPHKNTHSHSVFIQVLDWSFMALPPRNLPTHLSRTGSWRIWLLTFRCWAAKSQKSFQERKHTSKDLCHCMSSFQLSSNPLNSLVIVLIQASQNKVAISQRLPAWYRGMHTTRKETCQQGKWLEKPHQWQAESNYAAENWEEKLDLK